MVASTLGIADENSVFDQLEEEGDEFPDPLSGAHLALADEYKASQKPMHPWAKTMYKEGLSFNGNERSHLWLGTGGGAFLDLSSTAGGDSPLDGRSAVAADFDGDGDLDLFIHNLQRARHQLYRNEVGGRSLELRLVARQSQWEAIGAEVTVEGPRGPVTQVLARGGGFESCSPPELVFGLGSAPEAAVTVRWPSGFVQKLGPLSPGRYRVTEGEDGVSSLPMAGTRLPDPWPPGLKLGLGAKLPELVLEDESGAPLHVDPAEEAQGGRLLIAFWASFCGPCRGELGLLARLDAREDTTVLPISVDVPADRPAALALLKELAPGLRPRFLTLDEESNRGMDELIDLMRLPVPTTLEVDAEGRVRAIHRGPLEDPGEAVPSGR